MNPLVVLILVGNFLLCQSGSIQRNKRGYLSRTGICANPKNNFKIKDPRLNFWGVAYVLPDDANPKCTESECKEDSDCDADRKCCRNYCGGMVCTPTTRDPDPCKKFQCPPGQTCKVHYVPCVMPKCADAIAMNRPTCIKDQSAAAPAGPPTPPYPGGGATPQAPMYPAQPPMYQKQPLSYQLPQGPLPQLPPYNQQAPFGQLPMPPPMGQMAGFHNDEPESDSAPETGLPNEQPNLAAGFNDALVNAVQNENQPLNFQNESPLNSDQNNFFPPPVEQQQLASEPANQFPADIYPAAPGTQHAWDRSSKVQ